MAYGFSIARTTCASLLMVSATLLGATAADANVYTYDLQVGAYQIDMDPATFGTHGDVFLQLSNGASTNVNQTYTYQDIVGALARTDGTFAITPFQPVSYNGTGSDTDIFATTDSLGNLTLNQPTINDPSLYPDGFLTTDPSNTYALKWYLWTYDAVTQLPIYYFKWSDVFASDTASGVVTNVALVPEPATWTTMLLGFGAIGGAMRRARRTRTAGAAAP